MVVCLKVKTDKMEKSSPAWASERPYLKIQTKKRGSEKGEKEEGLGNKEEREGGRKNPSTHTGRLQLFALVKKVEKQAQTHNVKFPNFKLKDI